MSPLARFCAHATEVLRRHVADCIGDEPASLVGYCAHRNVGDNAIALGEDIVLKGRRVVRVADDRPRSVKGPVLIHGGGNIGDLYPRLCNQWCDVLESDPARPVLQLPQSIHFDDLEKATRYRASVAAHRAFRLLVRDQASLAWAERHLDCDVRLAPDAAFALGPLRPPVDARLDLLVLARSDRESLHEDTSYLGAVDWLTEPSVFRAPSLWPRPVRSRVHAGPAIDSLLLRRLANARLRRGMRLLGEARRVVTDRLHAVILCALIGIDVFAADNSYRKISNVVDTWRLDEHATIVRASSLARAVELAAAEAGS